MAWETHAAKIAFPGFAKDWDRLNAQLYGGHPFFDSRFVGPLLECFASGREKLCIHRANGAVSGALIVQPEGAGRWVLFRPSQAQASAILVGAVSHLKTLFATLPGFVWTIEFHAVDPRYSPDFSRLDLAMIVSAHARTIGIHPEMNFADYWESRSKNLKANVRRYFNRSEKEYGTPNLAKLTGHDEMALGVDRFGQIETAGWKGAAGTAVCPGNRQGEFYSKVLARFALSNQAAVYELHVGEQLAASRLVISNEEMLVILKTTYDESLARFAPGRILLYRLIEEQLENRSGKAIEFYTDATREQAEWSTFGCTVKSIQLFRNDVCVAAFSILKAIRRNLRGTGQRRPPLEKDTGRVNVEACADVESFSTAHFDLHEFAARNNIEVSIDWFALLQKTVYPDDPGVRYYFVTENSQPATILPVRLTTRGRVRTVESLGNYYTSLYTPLLSKNSDLLALRHLLVAATRDHGGAHVMRFAPMDPASPGYTGLLNELRAIGWIPFRFFCFGNWFLRVDDDWAGYLRKRSANLRSTIKRMNKKFAAEDGTLEVVTSPEQVEQAIAAFQEVYSSSWKIPEPYPDFVPSLIRRLADSGMLRLGIARLRGKPIAAQLWIVGEDRASIYKVAYDEAFAAFSPGTVLTAHLLQYVIEQDRVKEVDFLIGDDKYKQIWMSDRRERWGIVAYNPRTLIGLVLLGRETLGRIVKSARQTVRGVVFRSWQPDSAEKRRSLSCAK